jgi:hypothetical protein
MENIQRRDLAKAAAFVREQVGLTRVETFFARIVEGGVRFERGDAKA